MSMRAGFFRLKSVALFVPMFRRAYREIGKDRRGVAIIETAFALPLLLLIGLGGMELAFYVMAHSRISQAALGVADNASRIGGTTGLVREIDINEVFTGVTLQTAGLDWARNGRIILSSLERVDVKNGRGEVTGHIQSLRWQRCFGGLRQGIQPTTADPTTGVGPTGRNIMAGPDTAIMFVEVFYEHMPLLLPSLFGPQRIHTTAAFNVREARNLNAGTNSTGVVATTGVTPSTC